MTTYICDIITPTFGKRSTTEGTRENFSRSVADWVVDGGKVLTWLRRTRVDDFTVTQLVVVGLYAKDTSEETRAGETLVACWSWADTWRTRCCDCGCNHCGDCQCCCKMCEEYEECSVCACCCEHNG